MAMEKRRSLLFGKLTSREDCLELIKGSSIAFFVVAALQAAVAFFIAPALIIDGVLLAIFAGLLLKFKSRVAAVVLLLLSLVGTVITFLTKAGVIEQGGKNVLLALAMVWVAARATEATFKLRSTYGGEAV